MNTAMKWVAVAALGCFVIALNIWLWNTGYPMYIRSVLGQP